MMNFERKKKPSHDNANVCKVFKPLPSLVFNTFNGISTSRQKRRNILSLISINSHNLKVVVVVVNSFIEKHHTLQS